MPCGYCRSNNHNQTTCEKKLADNSFMIVMGDQSQIVMRNEIILSEGSSMKTLTMVLALNLIRAKRIDRMVVKTPHLNTKYREYRLNEEDVIIAINVTDRDFREYRRDKNIMKRIQAEISRCRRHRDTYTLRDTARRETAEERAEARERIAKLAEDQARDPRRLMHRIGRIAYMNRPRDPVGLQLAEEHYANQLVEDQKQREHRRERAREYRRRVVEREAERQRLELERLAERRRLGLEPPHPMERPEAIAAREAWGRETAQHVKAERERGELLQRQREAAERIRREYEADRVARQQSVPLAEQRETAVDATECPMCRKNIGETNKAVLRCGHQLCVDCTIDIHTRVDHSCPECNGRWLE